MEHSVRIPIIEICIIINLYFNSQKRLRNLSICVKIRESLGPKETIYDARIRNHAKSIYIRDLSISTIHILYYLNVKTRFPLEIENLVPPFARRGDRIRVENEARYVYGTIHTTTWSRLNPKPSAGHNLDTMFSSWYVDTRSRSITGSTSATRWATGQSWRRSFDLTTPGHLAEVSTILNWHTRWALYHTFRSNVSKIFHLSRSMYEYIRYIYIYTHTMKSFHFSYYLFYIYLIILKRALFVTILFRNYRFALLAQLWLIHTPYFIAQLSRSICSVNYWYTPLT